ncbi:MAG: Hsp70 family protein, partial [Candidatus Shapirobacteria bacterium]|nr:Hsp70 family protein [Candidatus Shapirobacteria bacterium]
GPVIWIPEIVEVDDSGRGRLIQSLKSVLTSETFLGTTIFNQFFTLEDLLSRLLSQIKANAENILGHSLDSVVLGRPVRYVGTGQNSIALSRMKNIGQKAGFKNIEFEYEPVGAALNYGLNLNRNQTILVYDFGGGTLDVCIMKFPESKVLSVSGRGIGGDLINSRLLESKISPHFGSQTIINGKVTFPKYFINEISTWYRSTLLKTVKNIETLKDLKIKSNQPQLINNLIELIVNDYGFDLFNTLDLSKIALSSVDSTIFSFIKPTLAINEPILRLDLENSIKPEIIGSHNCIFEALNLAALTPGQIDSVILTGGSSQIPVFINQIKSIFDPRKIIVSDHFTAVAAGLSLRAEQLFT